MFSISNWCVNMRCDRTYDLNWKTKRDLREKSSKLERFDMRFDEVISCVIANTHTTVPHDSYWVQILHIRNPGPEQRSISSITCRHAQHTIMYYTYHALTPNFSRLELAKPGRRRRPWARPRRSPVWSPSASCGTQQSSTASRAPSSSAPWSRRWRTLCHPAPALATYAR